MQWSNQTPILHRNQFTIHLWRFAPALRACGASHRAPSALRACGALCRWLRHKIFTPEEKSSLWDPDTLAPRHFGPNARLRRFMQVALLKIFTPDLNIKQSNDQTKAQPTPPILILNNTPEQKPVHFGIQTLWHPDTYAGGFAIKYLPLNKNLPFGIQTLWHPDTSGLMN